MRPIWINSLSAALAMVALAGCATNKEKALPHGPATMLDVWHHNAGVNAAGANRLLLDARLTLRRPLTPGESQMRLDHAASYTRTAQNEAERQFHRLPNPDLILYVFPHLSGTEMAPVPGYSTVFPLHRLVHYALPGERTEDY